MSARMTMVSVAAAGIAIFLIACQPNSAPRRYTPRTLPEAM